MQGVPNVHQVCVAFVGAAPYKTTANARAATYAAHALQETRARFACDAAAAATATAKCAATVAAAAAASAARQHWRTHAT